MKPSTRRRLRGGACAVRGGGEFTTATGARLVAERPESEAVVTGCVCLCDMGAQVSSTPKISVMLGEAYILGL